jgi:hypothetical protein
VKLYSNYVLPRLIHLVIGIAASPQTLTTPLWQRGAGGCHLNLKIDDLVRAVGFEIRELMTGYAAGPRFAAVTSAGAHS